MNKLALLIVTTLLASTVQAINLKTSGQFTRGHSISIYINQSKQNSFAIIGAEKDKSYGLILF